MKQRIAVIGGGVIGLSTAYALIRAGHDATLVQEGVVRLLNGALAGSGLILDQALRNAVQNGASLPQAARLTSTNAATYLGLHDQGEIIPNRLADFTILDENLQVQEFWVGRERRFDV
ncbi:FAD-dependent oxidoreductase [Kozakia baliensis]|uniref:FAD-dependent oxidoreductase n=1 Tax=Kozakia baliensis TaxID=153496 RepID=UPI0004957D13|nr:FAD-dependent oxidoreductase [Kozakia baliensis]